MEIDAMLKATITSLAQYIVSANESYAPILKIHYSVVSEKRLVTLGLKFPRTRKVIIVDIIYKIVMIHFGVNILDIHLLI